MFAWRGDYVEESLFRGCYLCFDQLHAIYYQLSIKPYDNLLFDYCIIFIKSITALILFCVMLRFLYKTILFKNDQNRSLNNRPTKISLGIIRKDKPVNDENGKKSIYVIEDNMFKFWYRFVPDNMTHIVSGNPEVLYEKIVEPQISRYMGAIFEEICIQYLIIQNYKDTLPIMFGNIGRWWGGNPTLKKQEEIDIMAVDNNESVIFGECKWTKDQVDESILDNLIRRGDMFKYTNKYYYIFSKTGFTDNCIEKARKNLNVKLIEFKNML